MRAGADYEGTSCGEVCVTTDGPEYCVKNRSKTKISMFLSFWQFLIEHVAELVEDNLQAEHLFLLTYGRSKNKEI